MLSRARLPAGHGLAGLETFKILAGEFAAPLSTYNPAFNLVAGLANFNTLGKLTRWKQAGASSYLHLTLRPIAPVIYC